MKRRAFLQNSAIATVASSFVLPFQGCSASASKSLGNLTGVGKKAKNIIFLVSDGMSMGTLNMADLLLQRRDGKGSNWINLYRDQRISRAIMDTASANSLVTDSAAASSSWGGGHRVPNGKLNIGANGEEYRPILQKFKQAGKKVGCVTTVPITHATPAGFCVNNKTRSAQPEIAVQYLGLKFDVMMGGGSKYFENRDDKRNLLNEYTQAGFTIVRNKTEMMKVADYTKPVLGLYQEDALPYELDRISDTALKTKIPTLAEMTQKAIDCMKDHPQGFVMQVEAGKVDWAAHANDATGVIFDQIAFDDAVKVAIDFAEKDKNTLVIITTDHGNANPGLYYGKDSDKNFEKLFKFTSTNDQILMNLKFTDSPKDVIEKVEKLQHFVLTTQQAEKILLAYKGLDQSIAYDEYKLPYAEFAAIQSEHTSVSFGGTDHTADFVELAMFGPGSEMLKPFMVNTELHNFMLMAAEVESKM
ncbi:MAG: alkaline phosphatase [Saprospiraceae bacterium]|nr:alkaline phosphatase [Saprospiraceae bacterium]